jgi:hypothetical protein
LNKMWQYFIILSLLSIKIPETKNSSFLLQR